VNTKCLKCIVSTSTKHFHEFIFVFLMTVCTGPHSFVIIADPMLTFNIDEVSSGVREHCEES
jgi:hypothetical protein